VRHKHFSSFLDDSDLKSSEIKIVLTDNNNNNNNNNNFVQLNWNPINLRAKVKTQRPVRE
jgi:hypothetical protein